MKTQEVAKRLVELCQAGQNLQAIDELYAPNIVSREPAGSPYAEVSGFDVVKGKSEQWYANLAEFHSGEVSDPVVAGNHFSCSMKMDITTKDSGRFQMEEVCVYEVQDGKIVSEQFFYPMAPQG